MELQLGHGSRRDSQTPARRDPPSRIPSSITRYRVRRVAAGALARHGAISGALVGLVPGLLTGALLAALLRVLHQTLEGWRAVRLALPLGASTTVNFVDLLRLDGLLGVLRSWDAPLQTVLIVACGAMLLGALAGAAIGLLAATLYNLGARAGGGVVVELDPVDEARDASGITPEA